MLQVAAPVLSELLPTAAPETGANAEMGAHFASLLKNAAQQGSAQSPVPAIDGAGQAGEGYGSLLGSQRESAAALVLPVAGEKLGSASATEAPSVPKEATPLVSVSPAVRDDDIAKTTPAIASKPARQGATHAPVSRAPATASDADKSDRSAAETDAPADGQEATSDQRLAFSDSEIRSLPLSDAAQPAQVTPALSAVADEAGAASRANLASLAEPPAETIATKSVLAAAAPRATSARLAPSRDQSKQPPAAPFGLSPAPAGSAQRSDDRPATDKASAQLGETPAAPVARNDAQGVPLDIAPARTTLPATNATRDDAPALAQQMTSAILGTHDHRSDAAVRLEALADQIFVHGRSTQEARFRVDATELGSLGVELARTATGVSVNFETASESTRAALADAQPRLVADARAAGLSLTQSNVDSGASRQRRGTAPGGRATIGGLANAVNVTRTITTKSDRFA